MADIELGSCVGVLYIEHNKARVDPSFCIKVGNVWYGVHNGRLVKQTKD